MMVFSINYFNLIRGILFDKLYNQKNGHNFSMLLSWIALNSVRGLGPVRIKSLIDHFGSPEAVFKESKENFCKLAIIPEMCIAQLCNAELFFNAEKQINRAAELGVEIVTLDDKEYPQYLKEIYAPPPILYVKGKKCVFTKHAVGIVGTRNPTMYGKSAASFITKGLVENNLTIISGLARGIDTVAHETCIQGKGLTVAVLGCGIDIVYPKSNEKLADVICQNGALISEFPLGTPPESYNFPRRNRIISGLSAAIVVVEAGEKSGSLITAHYALQQGREIFAVPGPINSPMSNGTFALLRDGASPVRNGNDVAESLRVITNSQLVRDVSRPQLGFKIPLEILSEEEKKVLENLSDMPVRVDDLVETTGLAVGELLCILLNLELKCLVAQQSGQQFVRI
jgi:DNA processing protein